MVSVLAQRIVVAAESVDTTDSQGYIAVVSAVVDMEQVEEVQDSDIDAADSRSQHIVDSYSTADVSSCK